ncbi:MAG TPA: SCP2 sterol-binding domain-containing protein [Steroidobacteraceae bacterium]|nr:SCP2 sterol-binding domain-containing protein [Steroidobacteraceae bacterium]
MLSATLEKLLNRGLPRSPRARELCAQLSGRSLGIELRDMARLRLASNGVTLELAFSNAPADASLSGGPFGFLGLLLEDSPQAHLQRGGVTLGGDTELAERFWELLRLLRPDAEEELSGVIGDVAAHRLAGLARGGIKLTRRALRTGLVNLAEYLGHERGHLVPRAEGEQFLRGVDALREDLDRLQARLDVLARRRAPQ